MNIQRLCFGYWLSFPEGRNVVTTRTFTEVSMSFGGEDNDIRRSPCVLEQEAFELSVHL